MASAVAVIITGLLLVFAGHSVARVWPTRASRLTVMGVVAFAVLVAAFHLLGAFAAASNRPLLTPGGLLATVSGLGLLSWFVGRRLMRLASGPKPGGAASRDHGAPNAVATGDPETRSTVTGGAARRAALMVGVAAALVLPHAVVLGVSAPPRGWDVLSYHLPRAVAWLQNGNLAPSGGLTAFYPGNGELLALFTLMSGTDRLTSLIQLPFALLGAVALYGMARELGARAGAAAVPAAVFLAAPMVLFQSALAKNDLIVTAMIVSATFLFLRSLRSGCERPMWKLDLAVSGLAMGLALGTKYSAYPLVAVAAFVVVVTHVWRFRPRERAAGFGRPGLAGRVLGLLVAATAIPAVFWLIQNWALTGSPVAPLSVSIGAWRVFPGVEVFATYAREQLKFVPGSAGWLYYMWIDRHVGASYSGSAGFGAAAAGFAIPGLVLLICATMAGREGRRVRTARAATLALVVGAVASWWFGGHGLPRFLLPSLALALAPIALVFDRTRGWANRALVGVAVFAMAFSLAESLRIVYGADDLISSRKPWMSKADYYHMPELIYELPPLTRVLVLPVEEGDYHRTFRYPLVGNLPGNDVIMTDDIGVDIDVAGGGAQGFHHDLTASDVEYIFIRTIASPLKGTWLDKHPDMFESVIDTDEEAYMWHRKFYIRYEAQNVERRARSVTKMYRVLAP